MVMRKRLRVAEMEAINEKNFSVSFCCCLRKFENYYFQFQLQFLTVGYMAVTNFTDLWVVHKKVDLASQLTKS